MFQKGSEKIIVKIFDGRIFEKFDFLNFFSYCHMKTAPPINTFEFFHTELKEIRAIVFIGGAVFICQFEK